MKSDKAIISAIEMKQGKKKYLDYEDFRAMVESLSMSQGFYSRLFMQLLLMEQEEDKSYLESFKKEIYNLKATSTLDFIYWLEC